MRNYRFALKNWSNATSAAARATPLQNKGGKFAAWLGKPLGSGAYGAAFSATYGRELFGVLAALKHSIRGSGMPPMGTRVVVKVSVYNPKMAWEQWLHGCLRECAVHKLACSVRPLTVRGLQYRIDARAHVPQFYTGGLFEAPTGASFFISVMARAPGMPLKQYLESHSLDVSAFLSIERAIVSLWMHGIVHADLHQGNVMFDGKVATIIDFGFAVVLSESATHHVQSVIKAALLADSPLVELNDATLRHVNAVQARRGAPFYHDDNSLLASLQKRLREPLPVLEEHRRRVWGVERPRSTLRVLRRMFKRSKSHR